MVKSKNAYYSQAHAEVLRRDGQRIAQQILACFKFSSPKLPLKKSLCLDVGTSNGAIAYHVAPYVKQIIGIDVDRLALTDGRQKYHRDNFQLKLFDGKKIPYPKNLFDLVIFRRTYGSITNPQSISDEIYRVLKRGGLCYFEGHNRLFTATGDDIERYKTYWALKNMLSRFSTQCLTPLIVKNVQKFKFSRLKQLGRITKFIPLSILKLLEPFCFPDFIWILKKPD